MSTLSTMYAEPHDSAIISSSCCLVQVSNDGDRKFFEKEFAIHMGCWVLPMS